MKTHWTIHEYEYFTCKFCGRSYWNSCDCTQEARDMLKEHPERVYNFCPWCGHPMKEKKGAFKPGEEIINYHGTKGIVIRVIDDGKYLVAWSDLEAKLTKIDIWETDWEPLRATGHVVDLYPED